MDALQERYERYKRHLARGALNGPEAMLHVIIGYLARALSLEETPPDETAFRRLVATYRGNPVMPTLGTEQRGLLVELSYALTQVEVVTAELEQRYGVLTPLPEDFIYRSYLVEAGVETVEALRGLALVGPERLEEVDGIGETRAEDVLMALAKLDAPETPMEDEEEEPPEPPQLPPPPPEPPQLPPPLPEPLEEPPALPVIPPPGVTIPSATETTDLPVVVPSQDVEAPPSTHAEQQASAADVPIESPAVVPTSEDAPPREPRVIEFEQTMTLLDASSGVPYHDLLLKGGFGSVEDVRDATDVKILDVIGIGPAKLLEIRAALDEAD